MERYYQCDGGFCPYEGMGASCRDMCGLGVSEETYDYDDNEYSEEEG
jgi:hypothetical protein